MWITFDVDPDLPRAFTVCRVPVDAHVTGDQGGEVLLFVGDGQLDTMEFNTYDASMLTRGQWELPPAASFGRPTANPPNPDYIANSRGEAAH